MQRKFLSSLFLIVLLNLLVKPFYILGIDAAVQNQVGEEVYGNYFALLNFSFLLNILLDLGITNYNTRNIAQHPQLLVKHFYKILSIRIGLFFLYASFTLFSGLLIGFDQQEFYLLAILIFNQFLVATIQFARSNFGGLHLFKTDAIISVLDRLILIILCGLMLWTNVMGGKIQIEWFIYAQTIAYGLAAIISISILSNKIGHLKIKLNKAFSAAILKRSFPYALLIFLMMMYNRVDAVMIERLLADGNEQSGIYAQGFRFLDAVNMFALLFAGMLLPIFARLIKEKSDIREMMELAIRILLVASLTVGIFGYFYQETLINALYSNANQSSSVTFGLLILSFIPVSITYVFGTLLTANGSLKALNVMAVFGLIINVVLNIILIRSYKAEGAALATLITQIFTALIQVILVYRIFKFKINLSLYAKIISFATLIIGYLWFATNTEWKVNPSIWLITFFIISPILATILGLLKLSDLKMIFSGSIGEEDQTN
ncbi:MAG: oligosaccharide flippase family protein [Crocinitomicaceae bacterium]